MSPPIILILSTLSVMAGFEFNLRTQQRLPRPIRYLLVVIIWGVCLAIVNSMIVSLAQPEAKLGMYSPLNATPEALGWAVAAIWAVVFVKYVVKPYDGILQVIGKALIFVIIPGVVLLPSSIQGEEGNLGPRMIEWANQLEDWTDRLEAKRNMR